MGREREETEGCYRSVTHSKGERERIEIREGCVLPIHKKRAQFEFLSECRGESVWKCMGVYGRTQPAAILQLFSFLLIFIYLFF